MERGIYLPLRGLLGRRAYLALLLLKPPPFLIESGGLVSHIRVTPRKQLLLLFGLGILPELMDGLKPSHLGLVARFTGSGELLLEVQFCVDLLLLEG